MRPVVLFLVCLTSSVTAGAQSRAAEILRRTSDSSAVVQVIEQFHQALAIDDTAAVFRMLAASAVYIDKDEVLTVADLRAGRIEAKGRWERVIERRKGPIHVGRRSDVPTSAKNGNGERRTRATRRANYTEALGASDNATILATEERSCGRSRHGPPSRRAR